LVEIDIFEGINEELSQLLYNKYLIFQKTMSLHGKGVNSNKINNEHFSVKDNKINNEHFRIIDRRFVINKM
jgi:hypothetical protein